MTDADADAYVDADSEHMTILFFVQACVAQSPSKILFPSLYIDRDLSPTVCSVQILESWQALLVPMCWHF